MKYKLYLYIVINTWFTKTNSLWLITESIKVLEIKTAMLFNLDFASNTILLCFFVFFLIFDLYFLIAPVITQIFNPTAELAIPIDITTKEAKAPMETRPVIEEPKIRN